MQVLVFIAVLQISLSNDACFFFIILVIENEEEIFTSAFRNFAIDLPLGIFIFIIYNMFNIYCIGWKKTKFISIFIYIVIFPSR